ncbi:MAG: T9SS type A sorting domain-containing protein, partial [Bacteroidia bacterium]|nr:T9SS type A sorting domain-containing protein [Bacteroidia bacterium]
TFIKNDPVGSVALAATSAGNFLYRFGDPAKYGQGSSPSFSTNPEKTTTGHKQIGGSHDIQWIKPGLPGEGNFLVFNNGQNLFELTPQSYIVEINPFLNASGVKTSAYVNPPDAGYNIVNPANSNLMKEKKNISKQVVFNYSSKNNTSFFSTIGSSAQRLPNGNTFVCAMNSGHFFEVCTADTSVVWEYINPFTRSGIRKIKTDTYPTDNAAFRAYRYTADHPALVGRDLTPGATMTGFDPDYFVPANLVSIKKVMVENTDGNTLSQNYPNPFSATTTIDFELKTEQQIHAVIYDLSGKQIKTLANDLFPSGKSALKWDGTDDSDQKVRRGLYFYVIRSKNQQLSKKMIYNP